jgi:hypothetical protein
VLVACAVITTAGAGACQRKPATIGTKENEAMSIPPQASRPPAPEIEPITHEGVRYVQDRVDADAGDQNGGYLAAIDPRTGEKLWRLKVYEVPDYSAEGVDNIGLYFRSMRLVPGRAEIEIENEAGGRYIVDLVRRTSTRVGGPERGSLPPATPKPKPDSG